MDVDAFLAARAPDWKRLDELSRKRRPRGAEIDELVGRYQQAATDLALVRSRVDDPALSGWLSGVVARARAATVGGTRRRGWAGLAHGVLVDFPVAVYVSWRWWVGTIVANMAVAAAMWIYLAQRPDRVNRVLGSQNVRRLVNEEFSEYYRENPARSFALQVWTNNALVAALGLLLGVTIVGTVIILLTNTLNLGVVGGAMIGAGRWDVFFGLISPHGILELTAVFVACGSGLRLGWAWVAPGMRSRSQSLAVTGRSTVTIALGLVPTLLVSGVIEAFVTPSGLPTWARIGIGVIAEAAWLTYIIVLGRRGVAAGETADLRADERESVAPVA